MLKELVTPHAANVFVGKLGDFVGKLGECCILERFKTAPPHAYKNIAMTSNITNMSMYA